MDPDFQSVEQTIKSLCQRRPILEPVLSAFEQLIKERHELAQKLQIDLNLPDFTPGKKEVLLKDVHGIGPAIQSAAEKLLPALCAFGAIGEHKTVLEAVFFESNNEFREELALSLLEDSEERLISLAQKASLEPAILDFAARFVISAVFRALVSQKFANQEKPWDVEGSWNEGYCPVCGSFPVIAWLDERKIDEKNAFLAGGGGKKHFHCDLCGANWKFRRGVCPACGSEGEDTINILHEAGFRGERLDWCKKCQTYCPTIDLREMDIIPNLDVMAPGMLHLDMVAKKRNLTPLQPAFWNMF